MKIVLLPCLLPDYPNLICQNFKFEWAPDSVKLFPIGTTFSSVCFPLDNSFNFQPIDFENAQIELEGNFTNGTSIRLHDNNERLSESIDLSDDHHNFCIPAKAFGWNSIIPLRLIEIVVDPPEQVTISKIAISVRSNSSLSSLTKRKRIHFIIDPHYDSWIWRNGEKNIQDNIEVNPATMHTGDVTFIRPIPEKVNQSSITAIRDVERLHISNGCRIVNSISNFNKYNSKECTFSIWEKNSIKHPSFFLNPTISDLTTFTKIFDRQTLLRLSDEHSGKNIIDLSIVVNLSAPLKKLNSIKNNKNQQGFNTNVIAVEKIIFDDCLHNLCRAYVCNRKVIGWYSLPQEMKSPYHIHGRFSSFDTFVKCNRQLNEVIPDIEPTVVKSVECLGIQVGAVDFLLKDRIPIYLEVNPVWGSGPSSLPFPYKQSYIDHLRKEPIAGIDNVYRLIDNYYFWVDFYSNL